MSRVVAFLPRLALFGVMVVVGFVISSAVVAGAPGPVAAVRRDRGPRLRARRRARHPGRVARARRVQRRAVGLARAPRIARAGRPHRRRRQPARRRSPAVYKNPSGFPRIPPITQFDGGPFQGSNCTLTSGAMLARLAFGIVTSGSTLRTLQDDQDGGTDLNDLNQALWRGYGVTLPTGFLRPGAAQGPAREGLRRGHPGRLRRRSRARLRLQKDFLGGHAIYLDGYYPGNPDKHIPEAYYVIDPLGRPHSGYEGDWWPASVVDDFATAFGGGTTSRRCGPTRRAASRPRSTDPDVEPIPHGGGGGGRRPPRPARARRPSASRRSSSPATAPRPRRPSTRRSTAPGPRRRQILIPILEICLIDPPPAGCPTGVEATFQFDPVAVLQVPPGRRSRSCSWIRTGRTWRSSGSPSTHQAPARSTTGSTTASPAAVLTPVVDVVDQPVRDDRPAREPRRARVNHVRLPGGRRRAGSRRAAARSGSSPPGNGVEQFDVALSQAASPTFALEDGLSPYLHLAPNAFAQPLVQLADLGGGAVRRRALVRRARVLRGHRHRRPPPPATARGPQVTYALSGIDADSVVVRAFPTETGHDRRAAT